jgi:U3 small nucleolar RNA-associated protein 18
MDRQPRKTKKLKVSFNEEQEVSRCGSLAPPACGTLDAWLTGVYCAQADLLERELFGRDEEAIARLGEERSGHGILGLGEGDEDDSRPAPEALLVQEDRARPAEGRRPVWEDPDDATATVNVASRNRLRKLRQTEGEAVLSGAEYEKRLRQQHAKLNPRTAWAKRGKKAAQQQDASDDDG